MFDRNPSITFSRRKLLSKIIKITNYQEQISDRKRKKSYGYISISTL